MDITSIPFQSRAYVTLLTDDSFFPGLTVLSKTLLATGTDIPLFVIIGPSVAHSTATRLNTMCSGVIIGNNIMNPYDGPQQSWSNSQFLKLNIWNLTCFEKVVYLDADTMIVEPIDELFDRDCNFAAAPDVFPPDKFNAGVLFIKPDEEMYLNLISRIGSVDSYDGGDTGFLNKCFPDWYESDSSCRLSFGYNAQRTLFWLTHERQPGYWKSIEPLKIIHFSSEPKPWDVSMGSCKMGDLEWLWWRAYMLT